MINNREYRQKTGSNNSVARTFWSNKNVNVFEQPLKEIVFDVPQYTTDGGSISYYSQDPEMIFTNLNTPFIRYYFTANTHSLSGMVDVNHQIFKLDFETFNGYKPDLVKGLTNANSNTKAETKKETVYDQNGNVISQQTTVTEISGSTTEENFLTFNTSTLEEIQELLENPFYESSVKASGITRPTYDYVPGQFIKTTGTTAGAYKKELFEDKGQYFVSTYYTFYEETFTGDTKVQSPYLTTQQTGSTEINVTINSGPGSIPPYNPFTELPPVYKQNGYSLKDFGNTYLIQTGSFLADNGSRIFSTIPSPESIEQYGPISRTNSYLTVAELNKPVYEEYDTSVPVHSITGNSKYTGTTVQGYFFTYFVVPNKPKLESPISKGELDTYSPQIYYSNVEDGDSSVIEVVYDLSDTGFTTDKFSFSVEKDLDENGIQRAGFPIKTDSEFRYRVGNVKSLTNIFGVNQKIVSFSDQLTGFTKTAPEILAVIAENDSPYTSEIGNEFVPPSLENETPGGYTISGTVTGSIVTGATLELSRQGVTITTNTNDIGEFVFTDLDFGAYELKTIYRGYKTYTQTINVKENLQVFNYIIELLWDNEYETWAIKNDDIIYD